jgi:hypothetical protein
VDVLNTTKIGVEAHSRLAALGIAESVLREAMKFGYERGDDCVSTHALSYRGNTIWSEAISQLRLTQAREGWTVFRPKNLELVLSPSGLVAIGISPATSQTGASKGQPPRTRRRKGSATEDFIKSNQMSFGALDQDFAAAVGEHPSRATWLLLHYHDEAHKEIRMELALPSEFYAGAIVAWEERLILESLPWDGSPVEYEDEDEQVDVPVQRRAN